MIPVDGETWHPRPSSPGLLLMDSAFKPICSNDEAIRILAYPDNPREINSLDSFLAEKLRSAFLNHQSSPQSPLLTEFMSGKRHYLCQAFSLNSRRENSFHPTVALLFERGLRGSIDVSQIAEQFHLTQREREAVECLMQGLTGKEIANRMKISPNTVKAF